MAMSKKALDFRKKINRNWTQEQNEDYWDEESRRLDYNEYSGMTGMSKMSKIFIGKSEEIGEAKKGLDR